MRTFLIILLFFGCFGVHGDKGSAKIKVIAFDAFPVFDPRPIAKTVKALYPEKADKLMEIWLAKQFSYTWLRTSGKQYKDFFAVTEDALVFATKAVGVNLTADNKSKIMNEFLRLQAWPDVLDALKKIKEKGYAITFLSNFTEAMLSADLKAAGLGEFFTTPLSTHTVRSYKPDPEAYKLVMDRFKVKKSEVLFVPFAAWDASGAKWFGYRTFWINRLGLPAEQLGTQVDGAGENLGDLVKYLDTI